MIPSFTYPRFKENQVLSYEHLNQLVSYFQGEDRVTRRAFFGAGIVHGLLLETPTSQGLRLRRGTALTTDGFLFHLEKDVTFVAARGGYKDPAGYKAFRYGKKGLGAEPKLWELLEEMPGDVSQVTVLSQPGAAKFLEPMAALLYLELTPASLDTCLDNHCINQGEEMRGVWRVLLAPRDTLEALRRHARLSAKCSELPWPAWQLEELFPERLYLHSKDGYPDAEHELNLFTRGKKLLLTAQEKLRAKLTMAGGLFPPLLEIPEDLTAAAQDGLGSIPPWIKAIEEADRIGWQHSLDHLRHLCRAWSEFVDAAFAFQSQPSRLCEAFPRHVLLGPVPTVSVGEPDFLRHAFVPSPALTLGGMDRELCRHRFIRLLKMCAGFRVPASAGVRVTPGAALDHILDEQAVPFYYPKSLLEWWHFEATRRGRTGRLPTYDRLDSLRGRDPQLQLRPDATGFYRVEGHQGRTVTEVTAALESTRRDYHLPFDVVTVGFGKDDPEATDCLCGLDQLKALYRVSADEMRCHITRLLGILGKLAKTRKAGTAFVEKFVLPDGSVNLALDLQKLEFITFATPAAEAKEPVVGTDLAATHRAAAGSFVAGTKPTGSGTEAAAAVMIAATAPTEGVRTVFLDNLKITYPTISAELEESLTQEVWVNRLTQQLAGLLNAASGLLTTELGAAQTAKGVEAGFNAADFEETIQSARGSATKLSDVLGRIPAAAGSDALARATLLRQELLLFLANCVPTRLVEIAGLFAAALQRLPKRPTLAAFLRKHPGLEHLGGVPRGGTLVLVCGPRPRPSTKPATPSGLNIATETQSLGNALSSSKNKALLSQESTVAAARSALSKSVSESLLLKAYGIYQASGSTNKLVESLTAAAGLSEADKVLLTENYTPTATPSTTAEIDLEAIYAQIRTYLGAASSDAEPEVVLADFCLPYLCCSECTCTTNVVLPPPPASLTLPADTYCKEDTRPHPFTAQPAGGVVTGPGVSALEGGGFAFTPQLVGDDEITNDRVTFTYKIGDQAVATLGVTVVAPPVLAVSADPPVTVEGGAQVTFRNETAGEATYLWQFGDGQTSTERTPPPHLYTDATRKSYTVKVTATREPQCAASTTFTVTIETVSITVLERDREREREHFCTNDGHPYPLELVPPYDPKTGKVEGVGTRLVDGEWYFIPRIADGRPPVLRYQVGGQFAEKALTLHLPPSVTVEKPVLEGAPSLEGMKVTFSATSSDPATLFEWRFDGEPSALKGSRVTRLLAPGTHKVALTAFREPCTVEVPPFEVTVPTIPSPKVAIHVGWPYCMTDPGPVAVTVEPPGGTLALRSNGEPVPAEKQAVVRTESGFQFFPARVGRAGPVLMTYTLAGGQSAVAATHLLAPPKLIEIGLQTPRPVAGEDTWFYLKVDTDPTLPEPPKLTWDFGDKTDTLTGTGLLVVAHRYREPGEYRVNVSATAGPCTDIPLIEAPGYRVVVHARQKPTLRIVDEEGEERTAFCEDDERAYAIQATPDGGGLLVAGDVPDENRFIPARFKGAGSVRLEYHVGGESIDLTVTLHNPPRGRVTVNPATARAGEPVHFSAKVEPDGSTTSPPSLTWDFGDGKTATGVGLIEVDHLYPIDREVRRYTVKAVADRDPCFGVALTGPEAPVTVLPASNLDLTHLEDRVIEGQSTGPIPFTIESSSPADALVITAVSDNNELVPSSGIMIKGSGAGWTVTVFPLAGRTGSATITLTVADGVSSVSRSFKVTVRGGAAEPDSFNLATHAGILESATVREHAGTTLDATIVLGKTATLFSEQPARRTELNDETRLGKEAQEALDGTLKTLQETLASSNDPGARSGVWDLAQVALKATLFLSAVRGPDLAASGAVNQALQTAARRLQVIRNKEEAEGRTLSYGADVAELLQKLVAVGQRPVLQAAAKSLVAALPRGRGRTVAPTPKLARKPRTPGLHSPKGSTAKPAPKPPSTRRPKRR